MILKHFIAVFLLTAFGLNAQSFHVEGTVSTASLPVNEALVTFIDESDSTKKYSALTDSTGRYKIDVVTSVKSNDSQPADFKLEQNYPNPFSNSTTIPYRIDKESDIEVKIYDILGREIKKITPGFQSQGSYKISWDGRNALGERVAAGIYFYQLKSRSKTEVKKMLFGAGIKDLVISHNHKASVGNLKINIAGGIYTVRIENSFNTLPLISPEEFNSIEVNSDTTINFTVTRYVDPLAAVINSDSVHQIIRGFGAANIIGWRPDMTASEIETAFGTGDGKLGFTILRLRISPNPNDWGSNITTALAAYNMGATIIASPWSPPASMKTNNSLIGGELKVDSYDDFAGHLNSFTTFMGNNGVPIYSVSVQNEPDITVSYESCDYSPQQMLNFMKESASLIDTKVMAPESFQFRRVMSDPLLNDSAATANCDIVAGHIYGGGLFPYPLAEEKGKETWMTEYLINSGGPPTNLNIDTGWVGAMQTAVSINNCMNAGMSAYVYWYIVRYYGPISDGTYETKGEVTKKGFVMSQFSRFIRPGYYRVDATTNPKPGVYVSAYKGDGKTIIVALNIGSVSAMQTFTLENGTADSFIPYVSSQIKNCVEQDEVEVFGNTFYYTLDASSITTFVSNGEQFSLR